MNIRMRSLVAATASAALLLTGVSSVPAMAATQTVTIWMDQGSKDAVGASLAAFDKANTAFTINMVVKDFGTLRAAAITAIPTGNGPDILAGAHDWTGKLLGAGVISPVSLGANAKSFTAPTLSGFQVYGKQYGVPGWTENIALVYNKKKVTTPVKTAAEFNAAIIAGKVGMSHELKGEGNPYHMSAFASSFGIDQYVRSGGSWTTTVGFTDTASKGGLSKYVSWLNGTGSKLSFQDYGATAAKVQDPNNAVSYWVTGPWGVADLQKDGAYGTPTVKTIGLKASEIGVTVIPSVGGKPVHQFAGVRGYWQSVKVPGSAKAASVGKVLGHLAGPVAQLASFTTKGNTPANQVALKKVSDQFIKGFGTAGTGAYPMPSFVFQDTTWKKIGTAEVEALKGGSVSGFEAAVKSLQETIDAG